MVLPDSHGIPRAPWYSGTLLRGMFLSLTGLSPALAETFQTRSAKNTLCNSFAVRYNRNVGPATPSTQTRTGLQRRRFGLLPFRSPLLWQSLFYFLFLRLLRWFSSPRILPQPMDSVKDIPYGMGCPIRKSPDQRVFAAPRSLSQLATSFVGSQCQGIRRVPLVS
jgi:hypothetical protein